MTLGLEMLLEANNCIFPVAETLSDLNTLKQKSRLVILPRRQCLHGIGMFILKFINLRFAFTNALAVLMLDLILSSLTAVTQVPQRLVLHRSAGTAR